jgi:ribosomal protein L37E
MVYEEMVSSFDKSGKYPKVKCPNCGSKSKEKLISSCGFSFSDPVGTDRYNNSHDYRFHHKIPSVKKERAAAEGFSQTANPYNEINDLENDKAWG